MGYFDKIQVVLFVDSCVGAIALLAAYFTASLSVGLGKEATGNKAADVRNVLSILSIMETVSSIKLDRNKCLTPCLCY